MKLIKLNKLNTFNKLNKLKCKPFIQKKLDMSCYLKYCMRCQNKKIIYCTILFHVLVLSWLNKNKYN